MATVTIDIFGLVKFVIGLLVVVAVGFIGYMGWKKVRSFFAGRKYSRTDRAALQARWREIEVLLDAQGELQRKFAVIEADKLLDHALKAIAMPGETLGERLKFAAYKYQAIRDVWWAHKVRNQLAH